jgi:eukaryotic-like serine/threonine-protein kinase
MTPERWQQIADIVEGALEMGPAQRSEFLARACYADSSLRQEVDALLASERDVVSSFLQSPPVTEGMIANLDHVTSVGGLQNGQVLAERFRLVRKLGEGGMGQVWLAEQSTPVQRQVALKLIRAGMYDEAVAQRFRVECQSLAIMDHPAIAKVFDAGATPQGQPYFVMEYVPGLPITEYCDQKKLTIRDRLELLIQACEGVQHAHQKAIIHRDLKPANILVVDVDGRPVPRVIDFGLAKAAVPQPEQSAHTQLGQFVGTPGYMSPEQADPNVKDIDTRTDVYSLGAVLYVLLSGARPFTRKADEDLPLDELLRRLREDEPLSPSQRVSSDRAASRATAEARGTGPRQLVGMLRGDLDWITMKALEKDRARRYGTPSELAADIQRYVRHEPVVARPLSAGYRVRKYMRRHRVGLAAASAVGLAILIAAGISIREGIRANREAAVAQAVNDFLQNDVLAQAGVSAQSGPATMPNPDLNVRTALDRAAERIEGKFSRQPEVEASIRDTMALAYEDLGLFPKARKQMERALELRRRTLGPEDATTLKSLMRLGRLADLQGQYAEAEALESEALKIQRRVLGSEHPDTLASMSNLAAIYGDEKKYALADELDTQTLEIRKRILGSEHPDTLRSMVNLGVEYAREGQDTKAEVLFAQTLEIAKRVWGPEHPDTVSLVANLGALYVKEGKYAQAEEPLTETYEFRKRVLGPEHADTAESAYNLACIAARRGDNDRALALLSQAVDHGLPRSDALGMPEDPDLSSLHSDPRFVALLAHTRQLAEAKQKEVATLASH